MTPVPRSPSPTTSNVDECARKVEALLQRSSAFVRDQLEQLRILEACDAVAIGSEEQTEESAWRQEQTAWQQQRALEEARIEEQLDHLTQAWRELEVEQRRLLMQGRASHETAVDHQEDEFGSETHRPDQSLDLVESSGARGMSSAAFQFQRLKREIRQQSQRRR